MESTRGMLIFLSMLSWALLVSCSNSSESSISEESESIDYFSLDSSSSEESEYYDILSSSEESSSSGSHSREERSSSLFANCKLKSTAGSNVHGKLELKQKKAGEPVKIRGRLKGLGPTGSVFMVDFREGHPSQPGACHEVGELFMKHGSEIASMKARKKNGKAKVKAENILMTLEPESEDSVIGASILVWQHATGQKMACCTIKGM